MSEEVSVDKIEEPPAGDNIPGLGLKPGAAYCGRCVQEALDVIAELAAAGIPGIVVGARALMYYGAHMAPDFWEICVPDDLYDKATGLFAANGKYDPWPKMLPQTGTLLHTYPWFTLKGVNFFFFMSPAFEHRVSCDPEHCEKSKLGVPYPKLELFAQSLLETQRFADLENLVDGMNLNEEWGNEHLDFSGAGLEDYQKEKNRRIRVSDPDDTLFGMGLFPDLEAKWQKIVRNKLKRFGPEMPTEKYETRFRIRGRGDPRLRDRQV